MTNNTIDEFRKSTNWGANFCGQHLVSLGVKSDCMCRTCLRDIKLGFYPITSVMMILCPVCGNKRCPKADDHRMECTKSNKPDKVGKLIANVQTDRCNQC